MEKTLLRRIPFQIGIAGKVFAQHGDNRGGTACDALHRQLDRQPVYRSADRLHRGWPVAGSYSIIRPLVEPAVWLSTGLPVPSGPLDPGAELAHLQDGQDGLEVHRECIVRVGRVMHPVALGEYDPQSTISGCVDTKRTRDRHNRSCCASQPADRRTARLSSWPRRPGG